MLSNTHLTEKVISAYLANRLSSAEQARIDRHTKTCAHCRQRLDSARQLVSHLGPTLKMGYGQPTLPPELKQQIWRSLPDQHPPSTRRFRPAINSSFGLLGALATIILLALSLWLILKPAQQAATISLSTPTTTPRQPAYTPTGYNSPTPHLVTATPTPSKSSEISESIDRPSLTPTPPPPTPRLTHPPITPIVAQPATPSPVDVIAFSFYNPAPHRQTYEIHLIDPDGTNHRHFPRDGVSEPALRQTDAGPQIVFRAWGEDDSPRSLLSSQIDGTGVRQVGGYWEDAHPDWSPAGDLLIYASQRESDRRWRLYTSRADGTQERNLQLAGHSPSFAPNGQDFAYYGCDPTGNRCGIWQANLTNPAATAHPILENQAATAPDWSPQNQAIAYMAPVEGNWELYLVTIGGGDSQRLTNNPALDGLPAWSPDGHRLAFLSNRGGNWGIWWIDIASGELSQVFAFNGGNHSPPHQAPFGQRGWQDEQLSWAP